jgi:UrcA family protein
MTKFSATLAGVATIALAAVPILALATGAQAAPAAVKVADIDVGSARHAHTLEHRVSKAAADYCSTASVGRITLAARVACLTGARAEIQDKLAVRHALAGKPQELAQR